MGVYWTNEDPDYEHEGYAVVVDATGEPWPNPRGETWSSLILPRDVPLPGMAGLRAVCDCGGVQAAWRGAVTVPFTLAGDGLVEVEASEDAVLVHHHEHVRQVAGTAMVRELRLQGLRGVMEIARAEGVRAVDRLRVLVDVERDAGNRRIDLVKAARAEGAEWSEIGAALGTSKQAAQQRYGAQVAAR